MLSGISGNRQRRVLETDFQTPKFSAEPGKCTDPRTNVLVKSFFCRKLMAERTGTSVTDFRRVAATTRWQFML